MEKTEDLNTMFSVVIKRIYVSETDIESKVNET